MDEKIWSSLAAYVYQAQSLIEKIDFEVKEVTFSYTKFLANVL
jgi:hypothetical protein